MSSSIENLTLGFYIDQHRPTAPARSAFLHLSGRKTLSRIAEIGYGLIRCSEEHTTSRKRKPKENSFSGKTGEADSEMLVGRPLTLVWFYAVENGIGFLRR
jgi:hypothetical protein